MHRFPTIHRLLCSTPSVCVVAILVCSLGCAGKTPEVANPVLSAAPPRKPGATASQQSLAQQSATRTADAESDIVGVSFESSGKDDWNDIAAHVDGIPVFARDVLEADKPRLDVLKKQAPEDIYRAQRDQLLKLRLPQHLEQQLLLSAAKEELPAEAMTSVEEQLDELFLDEIERLKGIAKVTNIADLENVLANQGTSLASLRRAFFDRQLAGQYLGLKASKIDPPSKTDIEAEYQRRQKEYQLPGDVKWQQLWISYSKHGGKEGAFDVLSRAVAEIKAGTPFDVVIGQYSDGVMKDQGGVWDYTTRGNLSSKDVEDALFSLPVGEVSRPYDVGNAFQIVRVADRRPDRVRPFSEVQAALTKELSDKSQNDAMANIIGDLWTQATVTTRFDDDPQWQEMIQKRYLSAVSAGGRSSPPNTN